jgi:hypothetical protein
MKRLRTGALAVLGIAAVTVLARAGTGGEAQGVPRYDSKAEVTLKGKVETVETTPGGVRFVLETAEERLEVRLGPAWFLELAGFSVQAGNELQVTGSRAAVGGKDVLLAREVTMNRATTTLRDAQGVPIWSEGPWR